MFVYRIASYCPESTAPHATALIPPGATGLWAFPLSRCSGSISGGPGILSRRDRGRDQASAEAGAAGVRNLGGFLIRLVVGVDRPESVVLAVEQVVGGEQTHQEAVVLVVVLERAAPTDRGEAFEAVQIGDDPVQVRSVSRRGRPDTTGAPGRSCRRGLRLSRSGRSSGSRRGPTEQALFGLGPERVFVVAPVFPARRIEVGLSPYNSGTQLRKLVTRPVRSSGECT